MTPNIIYLHGFASSPNSSKARFFAKRFAEHGVVMRIPDLNVPRFEELTLTAMLARVAEEVRACPQGEVYLIGSSMGGAVALHYVERYADTRVRKLLLLAPALDFVANRTRQLGADGLARWQETGWLTTYHYGYGNDRQVHYGLMEDLMRYDSFALTSVVPTLIFHGTNDASVDASQSIRYAERRPHVDLRLVDSDHELLDQKETIWSAMRMFFGSREDARA